MIEFDERYEEVVTSDGRTRLVSSKSYMERKSRVYAKLRAREARRKLFELEEQQRTQEERLKEQRVFFAYVVLSIILIVTLLPAIASIKVTGNSGEVVFIIFATIVLIAIPVFGFRLIPKNTDNLDDLDDELWQKTNSSNFFKLRAEALGITELELEERDKLRRKRSRR